MATIYGQNEGADRLKSETMKTPMFGCSKNSLSGQASHCPEKEEKEEKEDRHKHAMGGVAKLRKGFPDVLKPLH